MTKSAGAGAKCTDCKRAMSMMGKKSKAVRSGKEKKTTTSKKRY